MKPKAYPCLFLDRDGVVNLDKGYVHKVEDFEFMPGIFEISRAAKANGQLVVLVTNQSGIGRGFYTEEQFWELMTWVESRFLEEGITIDGVYPCPHSPEDSSSFSGDACDCRKPKPGLILKAGRDLDIDLEESIFIGDKESDMLAARAAGVGKYYLLGSEVTSGDFLSYADLDQIRAVVYGV